MLLETVQELVCGYDAIAVLVKVLGQQIPLATCSDTIRQTVHSKPGTGQQNRTLCYYDPRTYSEDRLYKTPGRAPNGR